MDVSGGQNYWRRWLRMADEEQCELSLCGHLYMIFARDTFLVTQPVISSLPVCNCVERMSIQMLRLSCGKLPNANGNI